jgi:DNA-binding MarR family transcriptional regulator
LTPVTFSALAIIDKNPGVRQTDLGKVLGIARSGVVKIINRLEASGFIVRAPVADDRRVVALELTGAGAQKWTGCREAALAHEALVSATLSDGEKKLLVELLLRIGFPARAKAQESIATDDSACASHL